MDIKYVLGGLAVLALSGCNPPVDPAQGWDEPSAYVVEEICEEEEVVPKLNLYQSIEYLELREDKRR